MYFLTYFTLFRIGCLTTLDLILDEYSACRDLVNKKKIYFEKMIYVLFNSDYFLWSFVTWYKSPSLLFFNLVEQSSAFHRWLRLSTWDSALVSDGAGNRNLLLWMTRGSGWTLKALKFQHRVQWGPQVWRGGGLASPHLLTWESPSQELLGDSSPFLLKIRTTLRWGLDRTCRCGGMNGEHRGVTFSFAAQKNWYKVTWLLLFTLGWKLYRPKFWSYNLLKLDWTEC